MFFNFATLVVVIEDIACAFICSNSIALSYVNFAAGYIFPVLFILGPGSLILSAFAGFLSSNYLNSRRKTHVEEIFNKIDRTPARGLLIDEMLGRK